MTALEYIQSKGLEYRIQSGQAILKACPFCGDPKSHFYMDQDEGAFFCHKCQERGNLITLKKHYGDYEERKTMNRPHAKPQGGVRQAFEDKDAPSITPDEKKVLAAARKSQKRRRCPLEVCDLGVGTHGRHLFQRAESFPTA